MKRILFTFFLILFLFPVASWGTPHNIALKAHVSSSSEVDEDHDASKVIDQIIRVEGQGEWVSQSKLDTRGRVYNYPWIRLDWKQPIYTNRVILYDRASEKNHTAAGILHFSDSTQIHVKLIRNDGAPKVVDFPTKKIDWVRFEITDGEGPNLGLSEIEVYPAPESYPDYISWVDPYIETERGRYFFFVTGSLPFGMIGSAPLTRNINQGGGGYSYNSTKVLGFPQIHNWMVSGLTLMPATEDIDATQGDSAWQSSFSHDGEIVQPGYHRLYLDKYNTWVEQTVTDRVSFYRFTYTKDMITKLLINLGGHVATSTMVNAKVFHTQDDELTGYFDTTGRVWGGVDFAKVFFAIRFEKPIETLDGWVGDTRYKDIQELQGSSELITLPGSSFKQSPTSGVEAHYTVKSGEKLQVKIAISYVSIQNAQENIDKECPHWDFDSVRESAQTEWNDWFGKIDVRGGSFNQKIKFYTDLWHVLLGRHKLDDSNGDYPDYTTGGKREGKHTLNAHLRVRRLKKDKDGNVIHHMYNSDALWLSQWNLNTLWGLAYPSVLDDFAASFLQYDANGGLLPRGPSAGGYTYIMEGCPATSLITSAYQRNILKKWPAAAAYKAMRRNHEKGGMQAIGKEEQLDFYVRQGYCPDNAGLTIQWAFEDWALGQMAKALGKRTDYIYFQKRATRWQASFNPEIGLILPRKADGTWLHQDPLRGEGYVQANAWQATFGLSHEIEKLVQLMGGNDSLTAKLNYAFEQTAATDFVHRGYGGTYVSYANQPGCSNAHVFSHAGKPWLTQYWVRRVKEQTYGAITPDKGYGGYDEDQGQMGGISALMAIGLFSLDGGSALRPAYDITSPVFDEICIKLDPSYYRGKQFTIKAYNNSERNCYIQKARLNGKGLNSFRLPHEVFQEGGTLELWLGDIPNKNWGTDKIR